jgi:DNA repair protein RadC
MKKINRYILTYRKGPAFETVEMSDSTAAKEFCLLLLSSMPIEKVLIIALNSQKNMIAYDYVIGVPTESNVYFQRVFHFLLSFGADSFIIAHNHPGGDTTSSKGDRSLRDMLQIIGKGLDIMLADCLIVAGSKCRSMIRDR